MTVQLRQMTLDDIPAGLALCRASGWNQTEADWRVFLDAAPNGAVVAVDADRVIGSAATLPYGPFTWVSMVLVDPAARGRGVGTALLAHVLTLVPAGSVARLDATPLGEPLYRKLGFVAEFGLARWLCDAPSPLATPGGRAVRPLRADDLARIAEIDAHAFGASRASLLARLAGGAPGFAWTCEERGAVRGYVFGRRGHVRDHLGPLVAEDAETAIALLDACLGASLPQVPGAETRRRRPASVIIDAPDDKPVWREALAARGFAIERPFLRMARGPLPASGDPARIFAITGPEFG